jgi:hypothetical protein
MSHQDRQNALQDRADSILQGPLKHVRAAALAAALVPLASVAAAPAQAQTGCGSSSGICGFVWNDTDGDGIQDANESPIGNASVTIIGPAGAEAVVFTDANGFYDFFPFEFLPGESYKISVQIPPGTQPSPADAFGNTMDASDSDGTIDALDSSLSSVTVIAGASTNDTVDFGFKSTTNVTNPGTGTPGYWMNHPEAWPVGAITIGANTYSQAQLITWMQAPVAKDKSYTMISSFVAAYLNVLIGNDPACVQDAIDAAAAWLVQFPVGSKVAASSPAWKMGEPTHRHLDNYNNGMYCAPHRD